MPNIACAPDESVTQMIARGQALNDFVDDPSRSYRLFVTLNSNTSSATPGVMRDWLVRWYNSLNSKLYRNWRDRPDNMRWQGWAFLEGYEGEDAEEVTLHWHKLIGPGPGVSPDKYADLMTSRVEGDRRLCENHMIRQWQKLCPRGTVKSLFIGGLAGDHESDLSGVARYCTKDLRMGGPHLRSAHTEHTPLPFR